MTQTISEALAGVEVDCGEIIFQEEYVFTLKGVKHCRKIETIQQPPQVRMVSFGNGYKRYRLAMPWTQITAISNNHTDEFGATPFMSISNVPIQDLLTEETYVPPLPNNSESGVMCGIIINTTNAKAAANKIWNSSFTSGYTGGAIMEKTIGSEFDWQSKTKEDPNFILNIKWPRLIISPIMSKIRSDLVLFRQLEENNEESGVLEFKYGELSNYRDIKFRSSFGQEVASERFSKACQHFTRD